MGRLNRIAKEIKLYGATRNHYSESVAKDEDTPEVFSKPCFIIGPESYLKRY